MTNLLDNGSDGSLDFNPPGMNDFSRIDDVMDLGGGPSAPAAPKKKVMPGEPGFVEWSVAELGALPLNEQL